MNDRVVGIFEDRAAAEKAMSSLVASGVDPDRVTVKRVLQPDHRGLSDSKAVHSLVHASEIREDDTISQDAGTVILIVEMIEPPEVSNGDAEAQDETAEGEEAETGGLDSHDTEAVMDALEHLGATDTHVVEATPPLDL